MNPKMARNEDPAENRALFVDEMSCIGCKQCVWGASATFRMEQEHGRSRVFAQWLDTEDKIQASIGERQNCSAGTDRRQGWSSAQFQCSAPRFLTRCSLTQNVLSFRLCQRPPQSAVVTCNASS